MKSEIQIKEKIDLLVDELLKNQGYKSVILRNRLNELKWVLE